VTGTLARDIILDDSPSSFIAACVVTFLSGFGGSTLVSAIFGRPFVALSDKWLLLMSVGVAWLLNYSPRAVSSVLETKPLEVVFLTLHSVNVARGLVSMADLGLTFDALGAPVVLACTATVGSLVIASLVYGNSGSILNSPTPSFYRAIIHTLIYQALCTYVSAISKKSAAAVIILAMTGGNLLTSFAPSVVPFEVRIAQVFHAVTRTPLPPKLESKLKQA